MRNFLFVVNAVLCVAVIILFFLVLGNKQKESKNTKSLESNFVENSHSSLPIAYINVDSLLLNYTFAKESNELLMKEGEDSRLTLNTKANQLQKEIADFQRKLENNAFLSRERAEREQERLAKKQQDLQELDTKLSKELFEHQQKINEQLRDTIENFLAAYNKEKNFEIILSNNVSDNILYAKEAYNITSDITEGLNLRYKKK